ncbi:MAG TPA: hypothetical protein VLV81_11395 [Acidimicrobiia bacterium]|nr:hypothetical protein [Acidimicrobiia bacterium]
MQALVFRHSLAREAMGKIGGEHYFDFAGRGLDLTPMITHRFPLGDWKRAVMTIARADAPGPSRCCSSRSHDVGRPEGR